MKKVKTFGEYEELAHRVVVYQPQEAVGYLAGELLKHAEEIAEEAKRMTEYNEDAEYEAIQEKLGELLLYLTELSKYAVYLDNSSHTPNTALEYIACKSLDNSSKKMEEMQ
jgi:hypothetical protein